MPRLHLGSDRRRGRGPPSRRRGVGRSSSSHSPPPPPSGDDDDVGVDRDGDHDPAPPSSEFDRFDYDDDDFDLSDEGKGDEIPASNNDGDSTMAAPAAAATQKPPPSTKKRRPAAPFYDSSGSSDSSSSDDDGPILGKRRPAAAAAAARKKKAPAQERKTNGGIGSGAGGPRKRLLKPTVSSPKITLSSIAPKADNETTNHGAKKKKKPPAENKNKPLGKPINKSSKAKGGGARNDDDDNAENRQPRQNQAPAAGGVGRGKGKRAPAAGNRRQSVSFSEGTKNNAHGGRGGNNKKRQKNKSGSNAPNYVVNCLSDTDDDENDEGEDRYVVIAAEQDAAASSDDNNKKKQRKSTSQKEAVQVVGNNAGSSRGAPHPQRRRVRVLPLRGLAVDNRALPAVVGDSVARHSFLAHVPTLLEGGLERGVLSSPSSGGHAGDATAVASLVCGTECVPRGDARGGGVGRGKAGALAREALVPRASYLYESETQGSANQDERREAWLSEFLAPVNDGFGGRRDDVDVDGAARGENRFDYGLDDAMTMTMTGTAQCASDERDYRGPDGFAAGDSWSYFGDLVEAIECKLSCSPGAADSKPSRRAVTLFTTDANLFADVRSSAHVHGLERFRERFRRSSAASGTENATPVSGVTIAVVETASVMQMMKTIGSGHDDDDDSITMDTRSGIIESEYDISSGPSSSFLPSRLHVIRCVNDIRRRIQELNHMESSSEAAAAPGIDLRLEFMEGNVISFQSLLQKWVNESFAQTYASSPSSGTAPSGGGVQGRLSFDLPETLDGIMCSISLDLQYTTLPNRVDSLATRGLVEDMRRLSASSQSSVEVVQTIPLCSVDLSLIHGVPMSARAAMEEDVSRYDEMRMLARQLWKYLSRNDAGLVLRVHPPGSNDVDAMASSGLNSSLGYHPPSGEQLFLLVCEEAVEKPWPQALLDHDSDVVDPSEALQVVRDEDRRRRGEAPCHGMLYRYATRSQILRWGNEEEGIGEDRAEGEEGGNSKEVSDHYLDYIERSLDTLIKTGLNPLLVGGGTNS